MRAGERLVRRKLKVHVVAGVDHFVAGQHGAFELEDIIYLGFVNQFGDAVLMPFERKDGEIVPVGVCQHAGQDMVWPLQALPKSFTVTDATRWPTRSPRHRFSTRKPPRRTNDRTDPRAGG